MLSHIGLLLHSTFSTSLRFPTPSILTTMKRLEGQIMYQLCEIIYWIVNGIEKKTDNDFHASMSPTRLRSDVFLIDLLLKIAQFKFSRNSS
jgi:hypothetical protein